MFTFHWLMMMFPTIPFLFNYWVERIIVMITRIDKLQFQFLSLGCYGLGVFIRNRPEFIGKGTVLWRDSVLLLHDPSFAQHFIHMTDELSNWGPNPIFLHPMWSGHFSSLMCFTLVAALTKDGLDYAYQCYICLC